MNCYPMAALERTMKIQEVILRALAKKISWWQTAEIIGITDRPMRRMAWRYSPLANLQQPCAFMADNLCGAAGNPTFSTPHLR